MKKYILFALSGLFMTSCVDTEVLPYDAIVGEDMWQTKDDVQAMVTGAYQAMVSHDAVSRMIVWGEFRSDDVTIPGSISNNGTFDDLKEIHNGIMDDHNVYAKWGSFYTVINRCNQVLEKAPGVMSIDPDYTESTHNTYKSQVLALRALAYFYLVRAFRDVPYIESAYFNSSQDTDIPQSSPGEVLDRCIADLEEAAATPLSPTGYSDWRKVGLINKDAINAILADVYLWRASMTHNASDYQKCVEYCDLVIESKKANAVTGPNSNLIDSDYPLINGADAYSQIFSLGNSSESILELQMQANIYNTGVQQHYSDYNGGTSSTTVQSTGFLVAPIMFATAMGASSVDGASSAGVFKSTNDYRMYTSVFSSTDANIADISKIVYQTYTNTGIAFTARMSYPHSNFDRNWIVYRLTDVMLMKAEALVAQASSDTDELLTEAFNIVKVVNDRSLVSTAVTADGLTKPATLSEMEYLVLAERQRELCFEGKRWFDLMRFNYRHTSAADIYTLMPKAVASAISSDMLTLVNRKYYSGESEVVRGKYEAKKEFVLYFPVYYDEINSNYGLTQNPVYAN